MHLSIQTIWVRYSRYCEIYVNLGHEKRALNLWITIVSVPFKKNTRSRKSEVQIVWLLLCLSSMHSAKTGAAERSSQKRMNTLYSPATQKKSPTLTRLSGHVCATAILPNTAFEVVFEWPCSRRRRETEHDREKARRKTSVEFNLFF